MTSTTSDVIPLCETAIEETLSQSNHEQILNGLLRGSIGFLIAPPDSGKSYLCLSIAYELALQSHQLLGISHPSNGPLKTLLWPAEDTLAGILPRLKRHLSSFSNRTKQQLKEHIGFYDKPDPICCAISLKNTTIENKANKALKNLIAAAKGYDLVILDTLREIVGTADEVRDDYNIRAALDMLAREANVAVLVVHHPTKDVSRGKEIINSVSGSGLSSTLSKAKLHLYLDQTVDKHGEITTTRLRHIKANYLDIDDQWRTPVNLLWSDNSVIHRHSEAIKAMEAETAEKSDIPAATPQVKNKVCQVTNKKRSKLPVEPQVIQRNEALLSEESKKLANLPSNPFGAGMASELEALQRAKHK